MHPVRGDILVVHKAPMSGVISKLHNEYWIRPDASEIPRKAKDIESACYW